MFNNNARNVTILFPPNARGNFVKNCLTLATNTADSSLKCTTLNERLIVYKSALENNNIIGPAHIDGYFNWSPERLYDADYANRYIHCSHCFETPQYDQIAQIPFATSYVVITVPVGYYSDRAFLDRFTQCSTWHDLPYDDILDKDKFISHCLSIVNECNVEIISEYYDLYYCKFIKNDNARDIRYIDFNYITNSLCINVSNA